MATVKKYYTQDAEKFIVTIDPTITATKADKDIVAALVAGGYKLRIKSEKRAAKAKERANEDLLFSNEAIIEALKEDKEALAMYEAKKKGKGKGCGFFAAKSYYKNYLAQKEGYEDWKAKKKAEKENKKKADK